MNNIVALKIENIKCVSLFEMNIESGKVNLIKGKNGSGKSTVIDSLWIALQGRKFITKTPFMGYDVVNSANDSDGKISLTLSAGDGVSSPTTLTVERVIKHTDSGDNFTKLVVTGESSITADNVVDLFKLFSIDLSLFLGLKPKQQYEYLENLLDAEKVQALNTLHKELEERAHEAKIKKRNLDDVIRNATVTEPVHVPDIDGLLQKMQQLQDKRDKNNDVSALKDKLQSEIEYKVTINKRVKQLEDELQQQKQLLEEQEKKISVLQADINTKTATEELFSDEDKAELEKVECTIATRDSLVRQQSLYKQHQQNITLLHEVKEDLENINAKINDVLQRKRDLFKDVGIQCDIEYQEDKGIVIDGNVLSNASTGQQIVLLCKLLHATFKEGDVRLCVVRNANVLDSDGTQALVECAEKYNITFLCEWVDNDPNLQVEVL